MAQRNFGVDINLNRNQLLNTILQNLSVHPSTAGLPAGFIYYNTTNATSFLWNGAVWLDLALAGVTNLAVGSVTTTTNVITNDNGTGFTLLSATNTKAGLLSSADKNKLDSMATGASVSSFSAGNLTPLFNTSVTNSTTNPVLSFTLINAAASTWFGNKTTSPAAPTYNAAGALTKTDDTNVTLTLGGSPNSALLNPASITVGWSGTLSFSRGGTGLSSLGTAGQLLRVNTGATALEYFTPTYGTGSVTSVGLSLPTSLFTITNSPVTTSGVLTGAFKSQAAKTFFAAPVAASGIPVFRAITPSDLGTGTANSTSYLRGDGTWFTLLSDSNTTTASTWSSEKIQTVIDNALAGGMIYKGGYNASTNTPNLITPPAGTVKVGYTYTVTTAGTFYGDPVEAGDVLIAEVIDPTTAADWTIVNKNVPEIEQASQTVIGITRYATPAEVTAGTATNLAISPATLVSYVSTTGKYTELFGDGSTTSFTISHNLGTIDVLVEIYEVSSGTTWDFQVSRASASSITIRCNQPPTNNQFKVIVRA